jgi:hypothetical protein
MYVIPLLYCLSSSTRTNHPSILRLYHAFQHVIKRHSILRTALYLDTNGNIIQHYLDTDVNNNNDMNRSQFSIINLLNDNRPIDEIINEILNQSHLFDLSKGHVINCHILRQYRSNNCLTFQNDDLLTKDDFILFTIHHAVFDGGSTSIFTHDLSLAYKNNCSLVLNDHSLQYIDYSVYERLIDMTVSRQFWYSQFDGYHLQHSLSLPVDRHRSSSDQRSGLASTVQITFNDEISTSFLNYASSHNLTLFQLGLATFYVFLFKLTQGQTDLCITSINANRYRNELQNMIGMFVSTLPYRLQLESHWSFDKVVKHVRQMSLLILEHSHYPLQNILADLQVNQSNVSFLETMFDFITVSSDVDQFCMNGANLEQISIEQSYEVAKFDLSVTFVYNPTADEDKVTCFFVCSRDLFEETTVAQIAQRFQYLSEQIFRTDTSGILVNECITSINKPSFILPKEAEDQERVNFRRLKNTVSEGM